MRRIICIVLIFCVFFSGCSAGSGTVQDKETEAAEQAGLKEIDRSVTDPDYEEKLTEDDRKLYKELVDKMVEGEPSVKLSGKADTDNFFMELLKQNPYFFLVDEYSLNDSSVKFTYEYSREEQADIAAFMDSELLKIVNYKASAGDNELDSMLKIYSYITRNYVYDTERQDNKQLDSPLFEYPDDEVYKMLRDKKTLCYGFAYVLKFCFRQYGVNCFNIKGYCKKSECGHMWTMFKYDGEYFNCDAGWDISDEGYSKLMHFGKTDAERIVDSLEFDEFKKERFSGYENVECTDERFKIFRGIKRFTYIEGHEFFMVDRSKEQHIFNTEDFVLG